MIAAQRGGGERAGAATGAMALLGSRRFGPLFATMFLSAFNDNAVKNALVLMIAYGADAGSQKSAEILIPLAGGLFILPFFLCSATAGQLADQHDRAWLIRLIKLTEIALMLTAAAGVVGSSTILLLALLCVMGIEAAFLGPLKYAILPDLLRPHELLLGNALVEAGTFVAILLGTIAGVLIAGRHGAALVAGLIVSVAIAAWIVSLAIPATVPAAPRTPLPWNLSAATARVLREAAREPIPLRAMLGISWFWLAGAVYLSQFPALVRFSLGGEEVVVTLFLTVFTIGIALGSLLCSHILGGRISARTVPWGALGIGLFSIDLWLASPSAPGGGALAGTRGIFGDAGALAHSRRPLRHFCVGRRLCRAALRAAAGSKPTRRARPHYRCQQYRQCRRDGCRGVRYDRAPRRRGQRPRPVSVDRRRQHRDCGPVSPAAAEPVARTGRNRRRKLVTETAEPPVDRSATATLLCAT